MFAATRVAEASFGPPAKTWGRRYSVHALHLAIRVLVVRLDRLQARICNGLDITRIIACLSLWANDNGIETHIQTEYLTCAAFHVKSSSRPGLQPTLASGPWTFYEHLAVMSAQRVAREIYFLHAKPSR